MYQNQGKIQPFGYTGYQRDEVSGTYYSVNWQKKWLNEKTTDGIKEIEGNFGKIKGTKWGNKIFKSDRYYRSQITRARNAWKNNKIVKPRFSTYMNGFIGVSGMEVIDKVTDLQSSYMPGINIKEELKRILNDIYNQGEELGNGNK